MKSHRTATHLDYAFIVRLLIDGDKQGVLVRSLLRSDEEVYPLLDISQGDYSVSAEGVTGFSLNGERCILRIADTPLHHVELKRGEKEWTAPEMSSIILLIPK